MHALIFLDELSYVNFQCLHIKKGDSNLIALLLVSQDELGLIAQHLAYSIRMFGLESPSCDHFLDISAHALVCISKFLSLPLLVFLSLFQHTRRFRLFNDGNLITMIY